MSIKNDKRLIDVLFIIAIISWCAVIALEHCK